MVKVITSRNTSVNKDKIPAIYSKLVSQGVYGTNIFDVGCGRWTNHIKKFAKENALCKYWYGFDPYNQTRKHNEKVTSIAWNEKLLQCNPNVFISSNVLNVINTRARQREYLASIFRMMNDFDECYITVYEGDKSGVGKVTKKDCWQENRQLLDYLETVNDAYRDTHIHEYEVGLLSHTIDVKHGMIRVLPAH